MSEIKYNTETKRGWRIILIDESGTDILHGYSRDKAESHAKKVIYRYNAFEDGGLVEELRTACSCLLRVIMRDEPKGGSISNEGVELANATLAKS